MRAFGTLNFYTLRKAYHPAVLDIYIWFVYFVPFHRKSASIKATQRSSSLTF